jgi:radical SAM superfamily enzyme YgiQ (UPF0313 family)
MDTGHWLPILEACHRWFPGLRRISCYAMATNVLARSDEEPRRLREACLDLLYMGPESGDDQTLRRIAKGSDAAAHVEAARRAREAGMRLSAIFLLGIAGTEDGQRHASASAELATRMDPDFLAALTVTVVEGTPLAKLASTDRFSVPDVRDLLAELRTFIAEARPTSALFRTNHASNYLPLAGTLPEDSDRLVATIDAALAGAVPLRPEFFRGL